MHSLVRSSGISFYIFPGSYNPPSSTSRRESRSEAAFVNAGFADINDNVNNAGDVERSIKARMAKRDGIMRCVAKRLRAPESMRRFESSSVDSSWRLDLSPSFYRCFLHRLNSPPSSVAADAAVGGGGGCVVVIPLFVHFPPQLKSFAFLHLQSRHQMLFS